MSDAKPADPVASAPQRSGGVETETEQWQDSRGSLARAERRWHALADVGRDGFLIFRALRDSRDQIVDFLLEDLNRRAAEFLDSDVEHEIGRALSELVPSEHFPTVFSRCLEAVETNAPTKGNTPGRNLGLNATWLHWRIIAVEAGVAVALTDIGWEQELSKQVAQASRLESIGSLAIGIAHDFNNMLSAIVGFSDLVRDTLAEDSQGYADLGQVLKAAERASRLTRYLLAFGKRQPLEPELVDVGVLLSELEPILARLAGPRVLLSLSLEPELTIWVDPGQIEQVIVNLVVNARDAMPNGGTIRITAQPVALASELTPFPHAPGRNGHVAISIADNGTGMDEATCARVFEPFFTTKRAQGGTGLGLASAYGFVRQSGGSIHVDSHPGRGTTFRIEFPLEPFGVRPSAVSPPVLSQWRMRGSVAVLVVESDESVREVARRILETCGSTVLCATTGDEAEAVLARCGIPVGVLLVSLRLPRESGVELARRVKARNPGTSILLMSGAAEHLELDEAIRQLGAVFVPKPLSAALLIARLHEALANAQRSEHLAASADGSEPPA